MFKRGPFSTHFSTSHEAQPKPSAPESLAVEAPLLPQPAMNEEQVQTIAEATERLRQFARSLAANVDAHQTEVQAVSHSLQESTEGLSKDVLCSAVNRLIEANETMQNQLRSSQEQIQDQANRLEAAESIAQTDALTKVRNRRAFDEHLAARIALGPGKAGTLMLLDIDNFKRFNDTYGHRTGDEVLRVVASVLSSRLDEYGLVARYGGEEFAVVMDGYSVHDSIPIIEAAREAIGSQEVMFENKRLRVTASIGLAEYGSNESSSDWIQHADDCLYLSKNNGRNCGHWSDAGEYFPITKGECPVDNFVSVAAPVAVSPSPEAVEPPPPLVLPLPPTTEETQAASPAIESTESVVPPAVDSVNSTKATEVPQGPIGDEAKLEATVSANPFPYLPDRETLANSARELGEHLKTTRMPMAIMAIQISERLKGPASRSLLQIVRAASRTIDQVGCDGPTTLLLCMPNTNAAQALERAEQIVRSAATLNLGVRALSTTNLIGIGVSQWDGSPDFKSAFGCVQELAVSSTLDTVNPIRVAALATSD